MQPKLFAEIYRSLQNISADSNPYLLKNKFQPEKFT